MLANHGPKTSQSDVISWFARCYKEVVMRCSLSGLVRRSLDQGGLHLVYQPEFDVRSGRINSLEALLRWEDSHLGSILPEEFVPLFEEAGVWNDVTEWVADQLFQQLLVWKARDVCFPKVSININESQLSSHDLVDKLLAVKNKHCQNSEYAQILSQTHVELEIHGSKFTSDSKRVERLTELKQAGFRIALDDFGYAMRPLSELPENLLDTVKIDMSYIQRVGTNKTSTLVLQSFFSLAEQLGVRVVVKGVETMEQLYYLRSQRCNAAQGNFISRPLPEHAFLPWLLQLKSCDNKGLGEPRLVVNNG